MGNSFINYNNKGFWISDMNICPLLGMLGDYIIKMASNNEWLVEYGEVLKSQAKGYFSGFTSMRLNEYIISEKRKERFIELLNLFLSEELSGKDLISPTMLNQHLDVKEIGFEWDEPLEAEYYLRIIKRIIDSLNGVGHESGGGPKSHFK